MTGLTREERQRSASLSDATPRAHTRPFALTEARGHSSSNLPAASGPAGSSATGAGLGGSPLQQREGIAQATREGGSQPASGRASPALSSRSLRTLPPSQRANSFKTPALPSSSTATIPPTFKSLESYSSKNVAAALEPGPSEVRQLDDVWQAVCVRVLPL